jgi:CBS-domain-containing membrane protein
MDRKFFTGVILFAMLGAALSAIGIKFVDNPVSFTTIIAIAILIDLNASWK